jgi:TonB-linked SusC/RagA family outer membrane protein
MLYGISNLVTQEVVNPLGYEQIRLGNSGWSDNFIGNTYLEINPMKGLTLRSQISINRNYWGDRAYTPQYYQTGIRHQDYNSLYRHSGMGTEWNWDNTISYNTSIKNHNFGVVVGQALSEDGIGNQTWFTEKNLPVDNYKDANFNWTTANGAADITASTQDFVLHRVVSFFGRLNYDYAQKYLLTAILRRDGSTRFGANNKWGTFPSISVGWVPSMEDFWKDYNINKVINFLKIRGSYGITGNDNIGNFNYISTISGGVNYVLGTAGSPVAGASPSTLSNPDLKWEQTSQTDIGFDARFLNDFNFAFDYFNKKTTGALQPVTLPLYAGVPNQPWANVGNISNTGFEFQLGYNKQMGVWTIGATANFATLKNKVTDIGAGNPYVQFSEATYQNLNNNVGSLTREVVGYPIHGFWGYKTNGIFQTQSDVQNYKSTNGTVIQPDAQPGDFRWKDVNGDGTIDENDVTYLGSGLPTYTYGLSINVEYNSKHVGSFDLLVFINGQGGNKIFQNYRRFDAGAVNFPLAYLNRWTGPGTSNSFPRLASGTGDDNGNFTNMSDFYLHDGKFLRIKNIQLGYSLPERIAKSIKAEKFRIYIAVENLATLTKYDGFDPEIGGSVFGVDKGFYPQSRTLMAGINLQF